jgi:putative membrane protein insertion efficiency factor
MNNRKISIFSYPLILIIYVYRYTLSPLIGNQCRFYPTCSHYAEEAVKKHGAWRGSIMAVRRLFRCHPWHEGGYDPVPDERQAGKLTERSFG